MKPTRSLLFVFMLGIALCVPNATQAEPGRDHLRKLIVSSRVSSTNSESQNKAFTDALIERLRKRLRRANVQGAVLEGTKKGHVIAWVPKRLDVGWTMALLSAPGALQVRVLEPMGSFWQRVAGYLPAGIELRQPDNTMEVDQAFLWSTDPIKLRAFATKHRSPGLDVALAPAEGGWRTYGLGQTLATEADVVSATARKRATGSTFVEIRLGRQASLADPASSGVERIAVLLDSELLAVLPASFLENLALTAPAAIGEGSAQQAWVAQIVGRLQARLNVELVVVED